MGPKRRGAAGGSPAKSEPGAPTARSKLLKAALSNSIQGRRRGGNNSLMEITNRTLENQTAVLDASMDTTMRKKGRAMAQFRASQEEETPRTIMSNFMEAHKEEAVNSSELFSRGRINKDQSLGASYSTRDRSSRHINADSVISDSSHQEGPTPDVSADMSNVSSPGGLAKLKHLKRKTGSTSRRNVTAEELDPDRDISRPTNRSMGDQTAQGSDSSPNETRAPPKRSRRTRAQVNYQKDDFDFTNLTLRQETPVSDISNSSRRPKKKPDKGVNGMLEDFGGLSPMAHALGEVSPDRTRLAGKRPKVPKKFVDPAEFSNLTVGEQTEEDEEGDQTLVQSDDHQGLEEVSMEQTKIAPRKRIEINKVDTGEFSNISVELECNKSAEETPKAQTSVTIHEGSMEETRVQPRRRTRKTVEVNAAEFTNISYQAEQSRSGADSKMEVEMPSLAAGDEEGLTVLGGSMEETKLQQRQNRNKPKDVYVDVANFTDLSVSGEKTGSFLINGIESPAVENIEVEENQINKEILGNFPVIIDEMNLDIAQPDTSDTFVEKEESRRAARAARNPEIATVARSPCLSNIGEESEEAGHGSRQQSRASSRPSSGEVALLPPDVTVADETATGTPGTLRHARRSVYEAGQPEAPLEGSLSLGESRADPAGESTRLGGVRSPQEQPSTRRYDLTFAPIVNSPSGRAPDGEGMHGNNLGKSLQEGRQEGNEGQRMSQSLQISKGKGVVGRAKSEVGIQYETPELERKAKRVSKRLSRSELYHTRINMEEVAEQGTQMTPVGELVTTTSHIGRLSMLAKVNETGVQVTPGLGEPALECTQAEFQNMEKEAANREDVDLVLDDVEPEEVVEKEAIKRADERTARNVDASLANMSRASLVTEYREDKASEQAEVNGGNAVEYRAEGRGALDNLHLVEDVVDIDTAAEEEDPESEEVASEQDEDEECEAEERATSDQDNVENDEEEDVDEDENRGEVEGSEGEDGAIGTVDIEQAEREMPPPGEHRFPDSSVRRAMRNANLERYLGMADLTVDGKGLTNIFTPESSPKEPKVVKPKKSKEPIKTTFPAKKTMQQFNRFSRYKLKKEAEDLVLDASEDFVDLARVRLKQLSIDRGDSKIQLCDIRRYMTECGFLLPVEEDTMDIRLFEQIRELHFCDEELQWELIPMRRVMGRIYPPEDIWREPDLPTYSKANKASSVSKKKGPKKADSARRLKVPRNSKVGFLDDHSEMEEERSKKDGVSESKNPASRSVRTNKGKGRK